jgi:hypothetical protein
MIEKKFRIYDRKTDSFAYFDLRSSLGLLPLDIPDEDIHQFTGLLDSYGEDIYETDILKNDKGETATIVWGNGQWVSLEWAMTPFWNQWTKI